MHELTRLMTVVTRWPGAAQNSSYSSKGGRSIASSLEAFRVPRKIRTIFLAILLSGIAVPVLAGFEEARAAMLAGKLTTVAQELLPAAEQGDPRAEFALGRMYEGGVGVSPDIQEAVRWYRRAADHDFVKAQYRLGVMYSTGQGVPRDDNEAVVWFRRAAELGNVEAQVGLGICYLNGNGVPQDYKEGLSWLRRAAEQGHVVAQHSVSVMYREGMGMSKDDKESVKWSRLAANQKYAGSIRDLGVMYLLGRGVPSNRVAAYALLSLAAAIDQKHDVIIRAPLAKSLSLKEMEEAQTLLREMSIAGNLLTALDLYSLNSPKPG
jgi:TPR repeat protein